MTQGRHTGGKMKLSLEIEKEIIKAYQSKITISEIEKQFNFPRSSIYRVLKRNGIEKHGKVNDFTGQKHSIEIREKISRSQTLTWDERKSGYTNDDVDDPNGLLKKDK